MQLMKELITIQGATRTEAEKLLHQAAQQLDPEASITSLQLFATRRADIFAVRPSRLCEGWDFSDLCLHLKAALAHHSGITAQAWLQLPGDTMNGLPAHQMLCIGFDLPSPDELTITDPNGTCYVFNIYTDEESGEEILLAEPSGTGDYHPRPKLQLQPLCHIAVGERRPFKRLRRLYEPFHRRLLRPRHRRHLGCLGFFRDRAPPLHPRPCTVHLLPRRWPDSRPAQCDVQKMELLGTFRLQHHRHSRCDRTADGRPLFHQPPHPRRRPRRGARRSHPTH